MILRFFFTFFCCLSLELFSASEGPSPLKRAPSSELPFSLERASSLEGPVKLEVPLLTELVPTGKNGKLTSDDVKEWFLKNREFENPNFKRPECLIVEPLRAKTGREASFFLADQVFFIKLEPECRGGTKKKLGYLPAMVGKAPQLLFVLKHYKEEQDRRAQEEIKKLDTLKRKFRTLGFNKDLPRFVFSELFYKYKNPKRKEIFSVPEYRYISLVHAAKGDNLWSLIEEYMGADKDMYVAEKYALRLNLLKACEKLGAVLANFHLNFMEGEGCSYKSKIKRLNDKALKTINKCHSKVHGDLHFKNIFWDKQTETISLIDIATLESPSSSMNWAQELPYLLGTLYAFTAPLFKGEYKGSQLTRKEFVKDLYKAFLTSYLRAFKKRGSSAAYLELTGWLKKWTIGLIRMRNISQDDDLGVLWNEIEKELSL